MKLDRIEGHTFSADRISRDGIVVDLGMNHGRFATEMVARYGSRIVGAEPASDLFSALPASERIQGAEVAVGGHDGVAYLSVGGDHDASILGDSSDGVVEVDSVTLATFLERHEVGRVELLKIDIEGAEIPMFENTSDVVLDRISQMTVEFHDFLYPELKQPVAATLARLDRIFWRLNFSLDNTDVMFIHRDVAPTAIGAAQAYATKYVRGLQRVAGRLAGG